MRAGGSGLLGGDGCRRPGSRAPVDFRGVAGAALPDRLDLPVAPGLRDVAPGLPEVAVRPDLAARPDGEALPAGAAFRRATGAAAASAGSGTSAAIPGSAASGASVAEAPAPSPAAPRLLVASGACPTRARLSLRRCGRVRGSPPRTSERRSSVIPAHDRALARAASAGPGSATASGWAGNVPIPRGPLVARRRNFETAGLVLRIGCEEGAAEAAPASVARRETSDQSPTRLDFKKYSAYTQ